MPIIFFQAAIQKILGVKRRCPKCGKEQSVPREKKSEAVKCRYCGAVLEAAKK